MSRFLILLSIGATAFSLFLAPAQAQNRTSYVSFYTGSNSNSCHRPDAACANLSVALEATEPDGEIRCLDNHQSSQFIITKPVTIDCGAPGTKLSAINGATAITIDLDEATYPNGVVTLRNLYLNALAGSDTYTPGADGIRVIGGGAAVHVVNSKIHGFAEQGIDFAPSSSVDLFVRNTIISNNAGGGVLVHPAAAAAVRGSLSNVRLDQNGGIGLAVEKTSGAAAVITVEDTQAERNGDGLRAIGVKASILLSGSTIAHNTTGLEILDGGKVVSSGNNTIRFNTTNGAPTSTVPLK